MAIVGAGITLPTHSTEAQVYFHLYGSQPHPLSFDIQYQTLSDTVAVIREYKCIFNVAAIFFRGHPYIWRTTIRHD